MPAPATLMSSPYRWRKVVCFHRRGLAPKNSIPSLSRTAAMGTYPQNAGLVQGFGIQNSAYKI